MIWASIQMIKTDCLHKIRPFLELSCERFRKVYQPERLLSVDESLVLFKGRLKFKQYIKTKRSCFGIKLYELATSHGITLDLLVYSGKGMFGEDDPNSDMTATERIPGVLMKLFLEKGHVLCTDNFYTSPALASHFLKSKTFVGQFGPATETTPNKLLQTTLKVASCASL